MTTSRCAGPGAGDVEQPALLGERARAVVERRQQARRRRSGRRAAASTRRRRSGQPSSCTWATTTSRHSSPLDRWAVSSRTASPRTPRSASVSAGICWARSVVEEARRRWCGRAAPRRGRPSSNSAQIASRSRWASRAADRRPTATARAAGAGQRVPAQSVPEHLLGGRAARRAGAGRRASRRGQRAEPCDGRGPAVEPVEQPRVEQRPRAAARGEGRGGRSSAARRGLLAPAQRPGQRADVGRRRARPAARPAAPRPRSAST